MQLSKTEAKAPAAPQERVQQMTCSDARQTRRRTRSLAQPHQGRKRQIRLPPARRERDVGPAAQTVKCRAPVYSPIPCHALNQAAKRGIPSASDVRGAKA